MAKITKPDMSIVFASAGSVSPPTSEKLATGWEAEKPPSEQMNYIQNRQDTGISYLMQMGIVEWDGLTEYQANSYVSYGGFVYKSLGVNTNKQPDIFPANWGVAFDTYGSADVVQQELDALLLEDDPFDQYPLKDGGEFVSKLSGTSFSPNSGIPTDNLSDVGHSFRNDGDTGMFKDPSTGEVVFLQDAIEKLRIKNTTTLIENSTDVVTQSDLKAFFEQYVQIPVGELFTTTTNYANPAAVNAAKKYGGWERYAEGRALVGYSSDPTSATPDWYKIGGNTFGEEKVALTIENIQNHSHFLCASSTSSNDGGTTYLDKIKTGTDEGYSLKGTETVPDSYLTGKAGAGENLPHNNIQPSIVVYVWRRIT